MVKSGQREREGGPVSGRLNSFQRAMLQWNGLHPYNAVHVARIATAVDPARLAACAAHVLDEAGLTNYSVEERRGAYRYEGGAVEVEPLVLEGGDAPLAMVHREMERQVNEPFPCQGTFQPFRWFLVRGEGESFVGLSYFHAVADAESVGRLLREVVSACSDEAPRPLRDRGLARRGGSPLPLGGPVSLARRIVASCRKRGRMRRSHRPPGNRAGDFRSGWFGRSLDPRETSSVLALAKRHGATVNDLSLAALILALAPVAERRFEEERRRNLSAGCVVNLRRDLPTRRREDFGLFLGSFSVSHAAPPGLGLAGLLADIHRQTEEVKRIKFYLAARAEFFVARLVFERQSEERRPHFYHKVYPVWGGVTNFKMDGFGGAAPGPVTDYYRAVSTGPAVPFIVGVTGFEGRIHFGFTHREAIIPKEAAEGVAERFLDLVLEKGGEA